MSTGGIPTTDEIDDASHPAGVDGGVEPAVAPSEEQAPPSLRETLEAAAAEAREPKTDERPRDEQGRFAPKAEAKAKSTDDSLPDIGQPKPASAPDTPQPATSEQQPAPSTASGQPPPGWSAEAKAEWTKLSPAIQAAVFKREQEVSSGFAKYAQRDRELEQVIGPRRQYYAAEGTTDTQAINNLWLWFEALRNTPQESFPALAQTFGFDLSTVASGARGNPQPSDPRLQTLEQRVAAIQQHTEQQNMAARQAELTSWSSAKDANGQPLRPHFEKVRVMMGRLMASQFAAGLDDAYEKAVKLTPEVVAEIAASEKAAAERAQAEAALKARPAGQRRAAVSVRGGAPNGAGAQAQPTSIRESLKQGFAEARGS